MRHSFYVIPHKKLRVALIRSIFGSRDLRSRDFGEISYSYGTTLNLLIIINKIRYGLHNINFKGYEIYVHYEETPERITIYCSKNPTLPIQNEPISNIDANQNGEEKNGVKTEEENVKSEEIVEDFQEIRAKLPPVAISSAHEALSAFLTSASEYQYKTENDFIVVLSLKEETLQVRTLLFLTQNNIKVAPPRSHNKWV